MWHLAFWAALLGLGVQDRSRYNNVADITNAIGLLLMLAGGCCFFIIILALAVLPTNIFTSFAAPITFIIFIIGIIMFGATRRY